MEYKRLTDSETAVMLKNTEGSSWDSEDMEAQRYIRLAEFEDDLESGKLVRLPCKVGDTVYVISKKALKGHWEEHRYIVDKWGKLAVYEKEFNLVLFSVSKVGKDYFLTKSEAEKFLEQKLKELKGEV